MPRPLSEASTRFTSGHRRPRQCICAASTEHKKTPMDDESIDAEKRADEITGRLNGLNVRVAAGIEYAAHILKRNSADGSPAVTPIPKSYFRK